MRKGNPKVEVKNKNKDRKKKDASKLKGERKHKPDRLFKCPSDTHLKNPKYMEWRDLVLL